MHPLLLSGLPMCCEVEFIEVQHQRQPLLALCVLERAAMRAGIVLRLETCPQEHDASWLLLEGLGRIYVERVDGRRGHAARRAHGAASRRGARRLRVSARRRTQCSRPTTTTTTTCPIRLR